MTERKFEKICPLSLASDRDKIEPCMEEGCAWWDADNKQCALLSVVQELNYMNSISERPHYTAKDEKISYA